MNNPKSKRYIQLGRIVKPHGLRGYVKVVLFNSSSRTLRPDLVVRLEKDGRNRRDIRILNMQYIPTAALVQFENVVTVDEAELLRGYEVFVDRDRFPQLLKDEYYLTDLVGFFVEDINEKNYGPVIDVMNLPANDVLIIEFNGNETMIPIVDEFIKLIDFEKKTVTIDLIEGFL